MTKVTDMAWVHRSDGFVRFDADDNGCDLFPTCKGKGVWHSETTGFTVCDEHKPVLVADVDDGAFHLDRDATLAAAERRAFERDENPGSGGNW